MKQSAFFYDLATGEVKSFVRIYVPNQEEPEGLGLCLCGEVINTSDDPYPLYRIDTATGKHRPATEDEIKAARDAQDREHLEIEIEDAQTRAEAAAKAGLTSRAAKHQARLAELKAELAGRDD